MTRFLIAAIVGLWASFAHAYDGLDQTFTPSSLTFGEKQFLQVLLARSGNYKARIDGAWGRGSQGALLGALPRSGGNGPTWRQVAKFTKAGRERLRNEKWSPARHKGSGVSFIVPTAIVQKVAARDGTLFATPDNSLRIRALSLNAPQALLLHTQIKARGQSGGADYSIKRETVFVTSAQIRDGTRVYARSEAVNGKLETVVVEWQNPRAQQAQLIIASILKGPRKRPVLPDGVLKRAVQDLSKPKISNASNAPKTGQLTFPGLVIEWSSQNAPHQEVSEDTEAPQKAIGVAFYINNTDMIAAARAVGRCEDGTLRQANGRKIRKVTEIKSLGLWVLTSNKRSSNWVRLGQTSLAQGPRSLSSMTMMRAGWEENKVETGALDLLGSTQITNGQTRFVTTVPVGRRSLGAPLFDASGRLAGVVQGRVEIEGLTSLQRQQLRPFSFASSTDSLAETLTAKNILFEGTARRPGPVPDNKSALVGVYCDP